jgi:hypothetical protein
MAEYLHEGHSIYDITYHRVWVTKYSRSESEKDYGNYSDRGVRHAG